MFHVGVVHLYNGTIYFATIIYITLTRHVTITKRVNNCCDQEKVSGHDLEFLSTVTLRYSKPVESYDVMSTETVL